MAVPPDTVRVNCVWNLPPNEVAVNTLHFRHEHPAGSTLDWAGDMTQRYANLVRDAFMSKWTDLRGSFSTGIELARFDAYHLDESGHTIDKATSVAPPAQRLTGSATSEVLPYEVALAVSLYAYDPTGFTPNSKWKRGRIYLPGLATSGVAGGRYQYANGLSTSMATVFGYMRNRVMDNFPDVGGPRNRAHPVILSRASSATYDLTHVRVNDLYDVQRRRQNNLVVQQTTSAIPQQS